jgi:hypothetical protein
MLLLETAGPDPQPNCHHSAGGPLKESCRVFVIYLISTLFVASNGQPGLLCHCAAKRSLLMITHEWQGSGDVMQTP